MKISDKTAQIKDNKIILGNFASWMDVSEKAVEKIKSGSTISFFKIVRFNGNKTLVTKKEFETLNMKEVK